MVAKRILFHSCRIVVGTSLLDLLIIMTKYTLILAPLEVFAKRTFLGQGPETAALPDPEQMKIK